MNVGGVERGVIDLAVYLQSQGIANSVVSGGGRLVEVLRKHGVPHQELGIYKKSPLALRYIKPLRRLIDRDNIDIVHARSRVPAWISFFASRSSRAHFVTTAHGIYRNRFFSEVMGWGKFVICPSKTVAKHMKTVFGVPEEKIVIISRWVDLETFTFSGYEQRKDKNLIVAVGRISPSKGYEHLIQAFKKAVRFNPYLKLAIVGSAERSKAGYFQYLKTLVNRFGLNYNVSFVGFRADVQNVLTDARMLVAPSVIEESFGRVIIEAFACGVPVIATRVGGYQEIVSDGEDGLLVEPANNQAIADAIVALLNDHNLAQRMVEQGRRKVETYYRMEHCLSQVQSLYLKTLSTLRLLVIKISSLGDLILALPSLKALRAAYPQAAISLVTLKKYQPLVYDCPWVDEVITLDNDYKHYSKLCVLARQWRRRAFDYIIDLQNNRASHLLSFLSMPRDSFGFSLRWGRLLSRQVVYDRDGDPLSSQEQILRLLGVTLLEKKLVFWQRKSKPAIELPDGKMIGVTIAASARWQSKNWPSDHIVTLVELIYRHLPAYKVVFFGDEHSRETAQAICQKLNPQPYNFCARITLSDLPLVLKGLRVFITPDTATLHLAVALGISTIALFGPTNPRRHVVSSENLQVMCETMPCSFCYRGKCKLSLESACLEKINPQQVFSKIKEILYG